MKKVLSIVALCLALIEVKAQTLAFPGAQGWGRYATGGRGGEVYHVTNLEDEGEGSLRDALSKERRIVVFDVAGVIVLKSPLKCAPNITIAGQTAPSPGITLYGQRVSFSGANNCIVRYLRIRGAKSMGQTDASGVGKGENMIFDHLSVAWGGDENFSITGPAHGERPRCVTLQNSIIAQGLLPHSMGGLVQGDSISIIGNLYADNSSRNTKTKHTNQYANNIVYNWKSGAYIMGGNSEWECKVNIQSNLFISGPEDACKPFTRPNRKFHAYVDDNWWDASRDGTFNPRMVDSYDSCTLETQPFDYPRLKLYPGRTLIHELLPTAGASLPCRDCVDSMIVDEVRSFGTRGALISDPATLPFSTPDIWPQPTYELPKDSDHDGMPDAWEQAHGTDPNRDDAMETGADGYANIERYINNK